MEETFRVWAYLSMFHAFVQRGHHGWKRLLALLPRSRLPRGMARVDLSRGLTPLLRRLEMDLFGRGERIAVDELLERVVRFHHPSTDAGRRQADEAWNELRRRRSVVTLPGGARLSAKALAQVLAYYGVGERGRTNRVRFYWVRRDRVEWLLGRVAREGSFDVRWADWTPGGYHVRKRGAVGA